MPEAKPFEISRVLSAPRALVYQVHTEPAHLARWMSPEGFETIRADQEFRVGGGRYHYGLRGPGGVEMWGKQVYLEIVPNEKIAFVQSFSDPKGGLTRHPMSPHWPLEMLATTTFEDLGGGKCKLTIRWQPYRSDDAGHAAFDGARQGMAGGFEGTFQKLEAYLRTFESGDTAPRVNWELRIERTFDAPRRKVFEAWSRPESVSRWFAPRGLSVPVCEMDFRAGGRWKLCMRMPDGTDHWMEGRYLEIKPPEKLVWECTLGNQPAGHRIHTTVDFLENGPLTQIKVHQVYSKFREKLPAEQGWSSTLENLAQELASG